MSRGKTKADPDTIHLNDFPFIITPFTPFERKPLLFFYTASAMANGSMSSHSQDRSSSSASPTKLCSKTYKKASQLYLTRRLPEALASLQPIIKPSAPQEDQPTNGDSSTPVAPIATAAGTWRIKVWNLYITLLSAIVDLGAEEGKKQFGQKEWKAIASQVREGAIWETVVEVGYNGHEGSVDAEVVYNLLVFDSTPTGPN
jgi:hypothetical protein